MTAPAEDIARYSGRRRTEGMRREEVAVLAGVSTDYYARLEQGRERHPSEQVLDGLAQALRLDGYGAEHLHHLVRPQPRTRQEIRWNDDVSPNLRRLVNRWPHSPAMVLGRGLYVLAANRLTDLLFSDMAPGDSLVRFVFLNPRSRAFYVDWEKAARNGVAAVHAAIGVDPDDPKVAALVGELSVRSPDFRRLWAQYDVQVNTSGVRRLRHPEVGELSLTFESLSVNSASGQQLLIYQAEAGSGSESALRRLDSMHRSSQQHQVAS
jgi:transcriptional regulator with XRE-family HTH domain